MARRNDPPLTKSQQRKAEKARLARRDAVRRTVRRIGIFALLFVAFIALNAWLGRDRGIGPLGERYDEIRAGPTACEADPPPSAELLQFDGPRDLALDPEVPIRADVVTSCGSLVIELDPSLAPESVNSFVFLAEQGFYDGTAVFRVVPDFVIAAGDPTATGDGGPGYRIPDERSDDGFEWEAGMVALTPGPGPDRSGSQFLIALADGAPLPDSNVIGRIVEGDATLERIASVERDPQPGGERSRPRNAIYLETITITRDG